jgi:S1-C subfamily serine protease
MARHRRALGPALGHGGDQGRGQVAVLVSAYEAGHPPAVGDAVLAYGPPYGLEGTATVGIPGGPLVNAYGEVLGLTTSIIEGGGIGFVVDIQTLCDSLLDEPCDG